MQPDVCDWLRRYLQDGAPHNVNDIRTAAKAAGYTRGELRDAKRVCGLVSTNNAGPGHRADQWYWALPGGEA